MFCRLFHFQLFQMKSSVIPIPPLHGFDPVISPEIHTLILGSFPGRESLARSQYYGHPRNQFWRLLSAIFAEDFVSLDYQARLSLLLAHRVGLWDVITMCEREGSLDARIKNAVPNDFMRLKSECPLLKTICFNGKVAGAYAPRLSAAGYQTIQLPSSSPAYASRSFEDKLASWRQIIA